MFVTAQWVKAVILPIWPQGYSEHLESTILPFLLTMFFYLFPRSHVTKGKELRFIKFIAQDKWPG